MDTVLRVVFFFACLSVGLAMFVMICLSRKPDSFLDHVKGVVRIVIVSNSLFSIAATVSGMVPSLNVTLLVGGVGFFFALHARDMYLRAHLDQQITRTAESGLTQFKRG